MYESDTHFKYSLARFPVHVGMQMDIYLPGSTYQKSMGLKIKQKVLSTRRLYSVATSSSQVLVALK